MKRLIINCWMIILAILLAGCDKYGGKQVWEGRAIEYGSHRPIEGCELKLYKGKGSLLGPVSFELVDTKVTGVDGKFKFIYEDEPYGYKITATAPMYYDTDVSRGSTTSPLKKDIELDPYAWLRLHIKNVNPVDENDNIFLESFSCSIKGATGSKIDTITTCLGRGNRTLKMFYVTFNNNVGTHRTFIEYTLGAHDTTDYLLEF